MGHSGTNRIMQVCVRTKGFTPRKHCTCTLNNEKKRNPYIRIHQVFHLKLEWNPSVVIAAEYSSLWQPLHIYLHFRYRGIGRHSQVYRSAMHTLFRFLVLSALNFLVAFLNVEKHYFLRDAWHYALERRRHFSVARRL